MVAFGLRPVWVGRGADDMVVFSGMAVENPVGPAAGGVELVTLAKGELAVVALPVDWVGNGEEADVVLMGRAVDTPV